MGAPGLDVAGAGPEVVVDKTEDVPVLVEVVLVVAMVELPNIGSTVLLPDGIGPGTTEPPEVVMGEAEEIGTGIGIITAGPVIDGVAEPETGAEELELARL